MIVRDRWRVAGWVGTLAIIMVVSVALSACGVPRGPASPRTEADVPARPAITESDAELWKHAQTSEGQVTGTRSTTADFVVGLKRPGSRRGVWQARILIDPQRLAEAKRLVLSRTGAQVLYEDSTLPAMVLRLPDVQALTAVRRLQVMDYVEPNYMPLQLSSIGCTAPDLNDETVMQTSAKDVDGDVLPWSFPYHRIPEAWERIRTGTSAGPGAGKTVAVIDTGVLAGQTQLQMPEFAQGQSSGRTVANLGSNTWDGGDAPWSTCDHGTRVAGLIAAPRDGKNIVGIAWKSDLVTVNALDSVVIGPGNTIWVMRAMDFALDRGARIINMSFGNHLVTAPMSLIEDKIRFEYNRTDRPSILFVGAAGTTFCPFGATAWPGYLPEVIQVAGAAKDRYSPVYGESCYGDTVDIAAVVDTGLVETPGANADDYVGLGASSGATATISGILALIWAEHPDWQAAQVRNRLFAAGHAFIDPEMGHGVPDAYAAVGGFANLSIAAPHGYEPGQSYTLQADTLLGEGPFTYQWSTGETTPAITRTPPATPVSQKTTLTVTDTREGKSLTASITLRPIRGIPICPDPNRDTNARRPDCP
jgi:subtilisin family serine protease